MKTGQILAIKQTSAGVVAAALLAGFGASARANAVTVTDITDWGTTPMEVVNADLPYLGYNGGVYAGINTLVVTEGSKSTTCNGFCIDPFHWSVSGPSSPYYVVPLSAAPKPPAMMNAATALAVEDLWAEFYSPTMTSPNAAGLQIAIWELVSSNAVASDGLPVSDAFSLDGPNDYGAAADIASLASYHGPAANLVGLTGPGQDYVIGSVPDGAGTSALLALTFGGLMMARPRMIKRMSPVRLAITDGRAP